MSHERIFDINSSRAPLLFGAHNENIAYIEKTTQSHIVDKSNQLTATGTQTAINQIEFILTSLNKKIDQGK